jgi:hypothetical protein
LQRVPRLYNKAWKSEDISMSALERCLSERAERESPTGVDTRYSSPAPAGHFAVLQMLGNGRVLDLLILEATGEVWDRTGVYRRVGALRLPEFYDGSRMAARKLSSQELVVEEVRRDPWGVESITIV